MPNRPSTGCTALLDLYSVHYLFKERMMEIISDIPTALPKSTIVDDFFDICLHRASDAVQFFDDAGTQKQHLDPNRIHRVMLSGHMQDIFFDEFSEYVFESNYFDKWTLENKFVYNDVASVCVSVVGDILRVVMGVLVQFPEPRRFFHPDSDKLNSIMSDLIIDPIANRRDVRVTVRFE